MGNLLCQWLLWLQRVMFTSYPRRHRKEGLKPGECVALWAQPSLLQWWKWLGWH